MLKQLVTKVIGSRFERGLKHIQPIVDAIREHEERLGSFSDEQVQAQTDKLRGVLQERLGELRAEFAEQKQARHDCADPQERDELNKEVQEIEEELKKQTAKALDDILPEAFATVREACRRLVGTKVVVIGHELEWDMVAIMEYPSKEDFVKIATAPEVAEFGVHRAAGLAHQLLVACSAVDF